MEIQSEGGEQELLVKGGKVQAHAIYDAAKISKWAKLIGVARVAGRTFIILGVAVDTYSFFTAVDKSEEFARLTGGWAGAVAGFRVGKGLGAKIGAGVSFVAGLLGPQAAAPEEVATVPAGSVVGGAIGGLVGGAIGAMGGNTSGKRLYQFVKEGLARGKR